VKREPVYLHEVAAPEARAAYRAALAANEAAWAVYDAAARAWAPGAEEDPGYGEAWRAYCATLGPLDQARAGLLASAPPQEPEAELTLFDMPAGAA
jgi:hypothetical protein